MKDKFQRFQAQLYTIPENRNKEIARTRDYLKQLDHDNAYVLTIDLWDETRRGAQNRLMWCWNTETGKHQGDDADFMQGQNKISILYPLMIAWGGKHQETALAFREVIKHVPDPKHQNWIADRLLSTSELSVKEFAEYLNKFQEFWGRHGVNLKVKHPDYDKAMGIKSATQSE